jgi:hypothetical protein
MKPFRRSIFFLLCAAGISRGAEESGYVEPPVDARAARFWSFQAPVAPPIPQIDGRPIDAFLLDKLKRETGITDFAPPSAPESLLRRLSFTLIGLPPSTTDQEKFLADWARDPEAAWQRQIDALLGSPHYGERWAQHWLDVARFAETDGFEHDKVRAESWRYRDWVVRALNDDLPYDQFVALQIAGDLIDPESAVATGFLLSGPDMPDLNLEAERRHNVLNELTGIVGAAFLGLTLECAQCHDHKTDPISQADFYRLRAVFEGFALPKKDVSLPVSFPSSGEAPDLAGKLYLRGDFRRPGMILSPGVPRVLGQLPGEGDFRLNLARWLTRPEHPLTARVIVNRVWQHHFGAGLTGTASDFGKLGDRPSHPELLDWLATEFVRQGWSLKWLHREIVSTRAWRQSSRRTGDDPFWEKSLSADPDNRFLSRQNRLRLDGESLRDAMLTVAGRLNPKAGGPGVRPPLPPEVASTLLKNQWPVTEDRAEHDRRSLYLFARRNLRYPLFDVFDRPDANQTCARRHVSTTAPQALTLLNDAFVNETAAATAASIPSPTESSIRQLFRQALGRDEKPSELAAAREFLKDHPVDQLCLALFNLNEFVYLD